MDEHQIRRSAPRGVSPLGGSGGPPPKVGIPIPLWAWLAYGLFAYLIGFVCGLIFSAVLS